MKEKDKRPIEIKKWMLDRGVTNADIARKVGVSGPLVSYFIHGHRGAPRVRKAFLDLGCPEELLRKKAA